MQASGEGKGAGAYPRPFHRDVRVMLHEERGGRAVLG